MAVLNGRVAAIEVTWSSMRAPRLSPRHSGIRAAVAWACNAPTALMSSSADARLGSIAAWAASQSPLRKSMRNRVRVAESSKSGWTAGIRASWSSWA